MARYQVQGPDGQVHVFEGPDGATPDQVLSVARQMFAQPSAAARDTAAWMQTINPTNGMSAFDRGAAGAGKALVDLARGTGQLLGLVSRDDVAQSRAMDAPLMATTGGKVGNVIGSLAPAAATALIPGANTITGGAAVGSLMGLLQPSVSTGETVQNVLTGGVAGAAVPTLVKGYQVAKAAAEPFYDAGKNAIVGRALNRAAGQDAPAVAQRLREASAPFVGPSAGPISRATMGELVPGSAPTVGQAAGNAGVAALERAATAANPEVTNAVSNAAAAQNTARTTLLHDLAGADGRRDFFDAARKATGNQLYGEARAAGVDQEMAQSLAPQVESLLRRPSMQEAKALAQRLAAENDQTLTDFGSVEGLDWLKKALDNKISMAARPGSGIGDAEFHALVQTKGDLMKTLEQIAPAYKAANDTFAGMSKPITRMDLVQAIADKSVNPLTGNVQPAAFARALNDKTAAQVTGMPRATLEGTLSPAQGNALDFLLQDLQRANAAQNVGRGAGSDTVQKLAYNNILEQAGVPTVLRAFAPAQVVGNLAARGADAAYGRANRELSNRLAQVMLDPQEAATLMFSATPQGQSQLLRALSRGGSAMALTAPAAANAQKQ